MIATDAKELAQAMGGAGRDKRSVRIGNAAIDADVTIATTGMTRVLQYEPKDLTISVEAGMKFADLSRQLESNQQMIPLDPAWHDDVTVGGVVAANLYGPRRRLYGTARDLVIGMGFATLEGKLIQSGGMVVKNVAGLDMAKLMIGSFGTLAAIATVNFKLNPIPRDAGTLVYEFGGAAQTFAMRDRILASQLQPSAIDVLNPAAALRCGFESWTLLLEAPSLPSRFEKEFGGRVTDAAVWKKLREFTPAFLRDQANGIVARYSTTHTAMKDLMTSFDAPAVARAGNGVVRAYFDGASKLARGATYVLEHAPAGIERWPEPGGDFGVMKKVKQMFDPDALLNRGMLYGRL